MAILRVLTLIGVTVSVAHSQHSATGTAVDWPGVEQVADMYRCGTSTRPTEGAVTDLVLHSAYDTIGCWARSPCDDRPHDTGRILVANGSEHSASTLDALFTLASNHDHTGLGLSVSACVSNAERALLLRVVKVARSHSVQAAVRLMCTPECASVASDLPDGIGIVVASPACALPQGVPLAVVLIDLVQWDASETWKWGDVRPAGSVGIPAGRCGLRIP